MTQSRSLVEKVQDTKSTYQQFRELLTPKEMTDLMNGMVGPEAQAKVAESGDPNLYAAVVQASMSLQRVIAGNNRTALIAAVMVQQGVSRPIIETGEGGE